MAHPESTQSKKSSRARFRPNFTISILYLIGFFFLFSILFMIPAWNEFTATIPAGTSDTEAQAMVEEFTRKTFEPLLGWMLVAATAATCLGIFGGFLPWTKRKA